jgi:hypothetical protein
MFPKGLKKTAGHFLNQFKTEETDFSNESKKSDEGYTTSNNSADIQS